MTLLILAVTILPNCSKRGKGAEEKRASPVAKNAPKLEPLTPVPPTPVRERVPSQGDCAPKYKVGGKGTCINNQPCRGFGVKGENGNPICTCYGLDGGCKDGERCDPQRLKCVPETERQFGRAASD
jgi:hypothetical protein